MSLAKAVVAVKPDGSMYGWFESLGQAERQKYTRSMILHAIEKNILYKNIKWMYKEDYDHYVIECNTHLLSYEIPSKGVPGKPNPRNVKKMHITEKGLVSLRRNMAKATASRKMEYNKKPVICISDGFVFPSIKNASNHYGIKACNISNSIIRNTKSFGRRFALYDKTKQYYNIHFIGWKK